eukprot:2018494-Amphidinium_carterae.1
MDALITLKPEKLGTDNCGVCTRLRWICTCQHLISYLNASWFFINTGMIHIITIAERSFPQHDVDPNRDWREPNLLRQWLWFY